MWSADCGMQNAECGVPLTSPSPLGGEGKGEGAS